MNKVRYAKARWYAFKVCNDINPLDLVHDCYVRYYNKHEQDLFDLDEALIYKILKQQYYEDKRRYSQFKWRGEVGTRKFTSLNEFSDEDTPLLELPSNSRTEDLVLSNELDYNIIKLLVHEDKEVQDLQIKVYKLMKDRYKDPQISEKINRGRTAIHTYKTNIKRAVAQVLNE